MKLFTPEKNGTNGSSKLPGVLLEENPEIGPSDGNNKKYHRPPAHYDDSAWHLGWTDGRLGQPEEINSEVLLAQARVDRQEEIRKVRDEIAAARAGVEALKSRIDLAKAKLDYIQSHYEDLFKQRNDNSSGYSLVLAVVYVVTGVALFLADMPLSLQLVADGFKIPKWVRLSNGTRLEVSAFFRDPWGVFSNLAEPLFLALGIALMGIIVKFFVDAVVLRDDEDPAPPRRTIVGVSAAFVLFVCSTVVLGFFRAEAFRASAVAGGPNASTLSYETATFIMLTLVFPIAGGLCFSAGWKRFERAKHYYFTLMRLRRIETLYGNLVAECSSQAALLAARQQMLESDGGELASSMADLRRNLYRHGYYRGRGVPETLDADTTLHGFCQRTLKRVLARKIRHKLQVEP